MPVCKWPTSPETNNLLVLQPGGEVTIQLRSEPPPWWLCASCLAALDTTLILAMRHAGDLFQSVLGFLPAAICVGAMLGCTRWLAEAFEFRFPWCFLQAGKSHPGSLPRSGARTGFADWVCPFSTLAPRSSRQALRFHAVHKALSTLALPRSFPDAPCAPVTCSALGFVRHWAFALRGVRRLCAGSRQAKAPVTSLLGQRLPPLFPPRSTRFSVLGFIPSPLRWAKRGNKPSN